MSQRTHARAHLPKPNCQSKLANPSVTLQSFLLRHPSNPTPPHPPHTRNWSTAQNKPSEPMSGHFWTRKCFFDVLSMLFRCCFKRFGVRISIDFASLRVAGRSFDMISMDFNVVSWFRAETHVLTTNEPLHSSPLWIHSRLGAVQFQIVTSTLSPNSLSDPRRTALGSLSEFGERAVRVLGRPFGGREGWRWLRLSGSPRQPHASSWWAQMTDREVVLESSTLDRDVNWSRDPGAVGAHCFGNTG